MDTTKLEEILNGMMAIHTCGNESIIMTHCMQELGNIIINEKAKQQSVTKDANEDSETK